MARHAHPLGRPPSARTWRCATSASTRRGTLTGYPVGGETRRRFAQHLLVDRAGRSHRPTRCSHRASSRVASAFGAVTPTARFGSLLPDGYTSTISTDVTRAGRLACDGAQRRMTKVILASESPRRLDLLSQIVFASRFAFLTSTNRRWRERKPTAYVRPARDSQRPWRSPRAPDELVICLPTRTVDLESMIMGKPSDDRDAPVDAASAVGAQRTGCTPGWPCGSQIEKLLMFAQRRSRSWRSTRQRSIGMSPRASRSARRARTPCKVPAQRWCLALMAGVSNVIGLPLQRRRRPLAGRLGVSVADDC